MKKPAHARIALGKAVATVETAEMNGAFRIDTAWVEVLAATATPVRLHLEGKQGTITVQLPLVPAWNLTAEIHERASGWRPASEPIPFTRATKKKPKG